MKIVVKRNVEKNKKLVLPTGFVLNPFAGGLARKSLKKYGIHITKNQAFFLIKELNRYRRRHPDWALVEVENAQGETAYIIL